MPQRPAVLTALRRGSNQSHHPKSSSRNQCLLSIHPREGRVFRLSRALRAEGIIYVLLRYCQTYPVRTSQRVCQIEVLLWPQLNGRNQGGDWNETLKLCGKEYPNCGGYAWYRYYAQAVREDPLESEPQKSGHCSVGEKTRSPGPDWFEVLWAFMLWLYSGIWPWLWLVWPPFPCDLSKNMIVCEHSFCDLIS